MICTTMQVEALHFRNVQCIIGMLLILFYTSKLVPQALSAESNGQIGPSICF